MPVTECMCVCGHQNMHSMKFVPLPRTTCFELKARLSEGSEFLKQAWAHLVVIGRRKKGPCVLGTGSKSLTQPSITQPNTVQNQPTQGKKKKKKHQQQDCSPSPLPTYPDSWPILIIPQQSPWQHFLFFPFFYKHCSERLHSFHFNISK